MCVHIFSVHMLVCVCLTEPVSVKLLLRNPLSIPVVLKKVALVWTFVSSSNEVRLGLSSIVAKEAIFGELSDNAIVYLAEACYPPLSLSLSLSLSLTHTHTHRCLQKMLSFVKCWRA